MDTTKESIECSAVRSLPVTITNTPENFTAGKIKHYLQFWRDVTKDKDILGFVRGVSVTFESGFPPESIITPEIKFSDEEKVAIHRELTQFLKKGIVKVAPVDLSRPDFSSEKLFITNVFLRSKPDGSARTILNLKKLNMHVKKIHFKMETLKSTLKLVRRNCVFAKVDLKDAYYSVPINERHKQYFRFRFEGQIFEYQCLPQGYTDAPRVFTKLTKPLMSILRNQGYVNSIYIDDILLTGSSSDELHENIERTIRLFDSAGFTIHPSKSVLLPTKSIEYLGFLIDSVKFTVKPTLDKSNKVKEQCKAFIVSETKTIQELSEIIGKLVALEPGNLYARLYYKRLENFRNVMLRNHRGNYAARVNVSQALIDDLVWWCSNTDQFPRPILQRTVSLTLKCDASMTGWGIYNETEHWSSGGLWSEEEKTQHINVLELLAVKMCLQTFCKETRSRHIQVFSDNTTAVTCVNKMGSNKEEINSIVREIWLWCKERDLFITLSYIKGTMNVEADNESRCQKPDLEWSLNDSVFKTLKTRFSNLSVDMFASRLNFKLEKYFSWKPDPFAFAINAFHVKWDFPLGYGFPPFCLIPSVLQKIEEDHADVVLVAPVWPTQPWFPRLLSLLTDFPYLLPQKDNLLFNPIDRQRKHPLGTKLKLMACKLSGKDSLILAFQKRLPLSSSLLGGQLPLNNTTPTSKSGWIFVTNGRRIHLKQM